MAIPEKREDLVSMGYVFDNEGNCRGCGAAIEWWITPNGKKMPMSVLELNKQGDIVFEGTLGPRTEFVRRPHWSDCPNADDFRKGKK
jgi:hypothetical protein